MRRAVLLMLTLVAGLAASPAQAASTDGAVRFVLSPGARFPERQFTVDLPPGTEPYALEVTENGVPVIPHLAPIGEHRVPLSVAVLLDTSNSMRGEPLSAAVDAAETLIGQKPARSEAAVFGFAETPYLIHGWSSSDAAFDASLRSIEPSSGTSIWDAVGMASQSLGERHGASRALVLLTDGQDTASGATVTDAVNAARSVHARVFVVGLPGASSDLDSLRQLVAATGGRFVQVTSLGELHRVYASLATELSQQYVLTYASQLRGTGRPVTVDVRVAGLSAEVQYRIPPITGTPATAPRGWWASTDARIAIAAGVGLLVMAMGYLLVRPKRRDPARRLRGYQLGTAPSAPALVLTTPRRPRSRPRPGARRLWARFAADVDRAELGMPPLRLLVLAIGIGTLVAGGAGLAEHQPLAIAAGPILGAFGAWLYVGRAASAWYDHFDDQLPDALAVLASSLRAGHSLLQAIDNVAHEADEKTDSEWAEVVRQTQLGIPVEDAIDEMTYRIGSRDLHWISLVARVQHQAGGNMAEMFDIVAETVRQRHRLRGQVRALTAQGRMTRWVLTIAPFALGGLLMLMSPYYINGFIGSTAGRTMIVIACCMIVIGSVWLKKIVEIEV
jgi:tight adherence protein B